jgi:hypothetical protein
VKPASELTLIEKGRNKALAEYHARQAKAEAFSLLGERYRELGMEETARAYDDRARDVCISARGFGNVIQNYDKKIEDLRSAKLTKQVSPDLRNSFRTLEHAARYLDEYNSGSARVRNHTLCALDSERRIQRLAGACARLPQSAVEHVLLKREADRGEKIKGLAEAEALEAGASYQNFRDAVESAEKRYDTISRALTGKPVELSKIKEPELDKPGLQLNGSEPNGAVNSGHRQHGPSVGAVVSQILNEMDREI